MLIFLLNKIGNDLVDHGNPLCLRHSRQFLQAVLPLDDGEIFNQVGKRLGAFVKFLVIGVLLGKELHGAVIIGLRHLVLLPCEKEISQFKRRNSFLVIVVLAGAHRLLVILYGHGGVSILHGNVSQGVANLILEILVLIVFQHLFQLLDDIVPVSALGCIALGQVDLGIELHLVSLRMLDNVSIHPGSLGKVAVFLVDLPKNIIDAGSHS